MNCMDRPAHLIDPTTGDVVLCLLTFHLDRIHGPYCGNHEDQASQAGLPFPLLTDADPIQLTVRPGMTPQEISSLSPIEPNSSLGNCSWWRWHAYAWTPFGWSLWPTPTFKRGRLSNLSFDVHDGGSVDSRLSALRVYVEDELGPPDETLHKGWFASLRSPNRGQPSGFKWNRTWGQVTVWLEPRDGEPQLSISWT